MSSQHPSPATIPIDCSRVIHLIATICLLAICPRGDAADRSALRDSRGWLKVDGKPFTYTLDDPEGYIAKDPHNQMIYRHFIKAHTDIKVGNRIINVEVQNWSILSSMCYFLANEEALKANPPVR